MCGIAGFFDTDRDYTKNIERYMKILTDMRDSLIPRGPDSRGVFLYPNCGLAHTRLSIIDLKDGMQAVREQNESKMNPDDSGLRNQKDNTFINWDCE